MVKLLKHDPLYFLVISITKGFYMPIKFKQKYDFMGWFSKMRASNVNRDPRRNWLDQLRNCTISAFSQNFTPISTIIDTISSRSRVEPRQAVRKCAAFTKICVQPLRAGLGKTGYLDSRRFRPNSQDGNGFGQWNA